jgi:LuxR family maltose regulon positive regulatory protein
LNELYRQNLFLSPLDEERRWFRTHHLLADLLNNHLRQTVPPAEIQALHVRASRWYEAHERWESAVAHAIQAEAWSLAADQIAAAYDQLLTQGRITTWQRWLAQLPTSIIETRPSLRVRQGWATFLRGEFKQAEIILAAARQSLLEQGLSEGNQALFGELATYLATVAFFHEEAERIIEAAEEALAYLPQDALVLRARATSALGLGVSLAGDTRRAMNLFQAAVNLARLGGNSFLLAHALEVVADVQFHTGQLHAAVGTCREIITLATKDKGPPLPFAGNGHVKLAGIYTEWRELARAEEEMATGLALNRQGGIGYNLLQDTCTQVRLKQALGDQEGALTALRQAETVFQQNKSKVSAVQLAACATQFWLNVGDVTTAASWAEGNAPLEGSFSLDDLPIIGREVVLISLARVRLAQGQPDDVLPIYHQLCEQALASGRLARLIEIGLLGALAYQMKRENAQALATLHQILPMAEQQNYKQIFVEGGEPMRHLLGQIPPAERSIYVQSVVAAFPDSTRMAMAALIEPLSLRELEVLRLIHGGLSNKEIAAELNVSLNTVKKHTTHIYGKLGVDGRTQAIARARELNLL